MIFPTYSCLGRVTDVALASGVTVLNFKIGWHSQAKPVVFSGQVDHCFECLSLELHH